MSALDDLRADVALELREHRGRECGNSDDGWVYKCLCGYDTHPIERFPGDAHEAHDRHVSERVMAMLAEKWGLTVDQQLWCDCCEGTTWDEPICRHVPTSQTRLVTDWRTDTGHPAHDDTDEGDER